MDVGADMGSGDDTDIVMVCHRSIGKVWYVTRLRLREVLYRPYMKCYIDPQEILYQAPEVLH